MRRQRASLCWAFAPALAASAAKGAPVTGGLMADPDHPARLRHHHGGPAFGASVGGREGFLCRGTRRADGNPFVGAKAAGEIDPDELDQWYGWFQTLDAAGVVTAFCFYDDLIDVPSGKRKNLDLTAAGDLHPQEQECADAVVNRLKTLKNLNWCIDDFFQGIARLSFLVPRNDLTDGNFRWVPAEAGRTYVACSPAATANPGVTGLTAGTYDLKWLDTIDGSTVVQRGGQVTTSSRTFARPSGIQDEGALVIVRR